VFSLGFEPHALACVVNGSVDANGRADGPREPANGFVLRVRLAHGQATVMTALGRVYGLRNYHR
jgi:hypothetical protein